MAHSAVDLDPPAGASWLRNSLTVEGTRRGPRPRALKEIAKRNDERRWSGIAALGCWLAEGWQSLQGVRRIRRKGGLGVPEAGQATRCASRGCRPTGLAANRSTSRGLPCRSDYARSRGSGCRHCRGHSEALILISDPASRIPPDLRRCSSCVPHGSRSPGHTVETSRISRKETGDKKRPGLPQLL